MPVAVGGRRAGRVAVAAAAVGIPFLGAAGVAAVASLATTAAVRQIRDCVEPIDVASQLRILRGDQTLGVLLRRSLAGTTGPGTSTIPLPWAISGADPSKTVDRLLVLAVLVALDVLRGAFAESALR